MNRILIILSIFVAIIFQPVGSVSPSWAENPGDESWSTDFYQAGVAGYIKTMLSQPGAVYAGGSFTAITNVPTTNVARLEMTDGVITQVIPLGEGLDSMVKGFCEHDGDVIAVGNFVHSGTTVLNHVASWDGSTWQPLGDGLLDVWPQTAASFQGQLFVGQYRWNGTQWEEFFPTDGQVTTLTVHDGLLFVGGNFTEAAGQAHSNVFAWNGAEVLAMGAGFPEPVNCATAGASGIIFSGNSDFSLGLVSRWDGSTWTVELENTVVNEVAYFGNDLVVSGYIYVGGGMFEPALRTNAGGSWHSIGNFNTGPLLEHEGLLLAKVSAGVESGIISPGLIGYNGTNMQPVFLPSQGFDGSFASVTEWGAMVIVGGSFQIADGQEVDGSALNNAGSWTQWGNRSDLDTSFPGSFDELEVVGSEIYGVYSYIDYDVEVEILVKLVWDTSAWRWQILNQENYYFGDLQTVGSELFAVDYSGASQVNLSNGSTAPLPGTDLDGRVYDSCDYLGTLTICGSFTTNNGLPSSNVIRYMNDAWLDVGNPLPGDRVSALATMDGLQLAACSRVDGVWRISIFDGANWETLPGDFDGSIYDLTFHRGRLFAAGSFDNVGPVSAKGIAVWTGDEWVPVGSGLVGRTYSRITDMESIGDNLYLTGAFTSTGGQPSVGFAIWTGDPTQFSGSLSSTNEASMMPARLLGNAYPNPFNPNTMVAFVVPEPSHIQIGIYDLKGNMVRNLVDESFIAGSYGRPWNGVDNSGRDLPSGIYFARMTSGNAVESVKLTLVR